MSGKSAAVIVNCSPSEREHMMYDSCWNCAPWWFKIPICPTHRTKLKTSGWCCMCRRYYNTDVDERVVPVEEGQ